MNRKLGVAILYGGKSVEHKISLRSARNIYENLDRSRFDPVLIGIDPEGNWFYHAEFNTDIGSGYPLDLHLKQEGQVFHCSEPGISPGRIDVAFPVLHGNDGEDGSIQGLFKTLNIPVVGTGVTGSAVSMDKILTKKLLRDAGIRVCRYRHFTYEQKASIN